MMTMSLDEIMNASPVMPVIVIEDAAQAPELASALYEGGIKTIEVTLRTPAALDAIKAIAVSVPQICVGAGTILTAAQAQQAVDAGARFGVSPGSTSKLVSETASAGLPILYGAQTVSEMMSLAEQGYTHLKFFPASASGGPSFLKSIHSPLPQLTFCPTGGISLQTAPDWLGLANVGCVGGSWLAPAQHIRKGRFDLIKEQAEQAARLSS